MPIGSATTQVNSSAATETAMVSQSRSPITCGYWQLVLHSHAEVAVQDQSDPAQVLDVDRLVEPVLDAQVLLLPARRPSRR